MKHKHKKVRYIIIVATKFVRTINDTILSRFYPGQEIANVQSYVPQVSGTSRHAASGISIIILGLCMFQMFM